MDNGEAVAALTDTALLARGPRPSPHYVDMLLWKHYEYHDGGRRPARLQWSCRLHRCPSGTDPTLRVNLKHVRDTPSTTWSGAAMRTGVHPPVLFYPLSTVVGEGSSREEVVRVQARGRKRNQHTKEWSRDPGGEIVHGRVLLPSRGPPVGACASWSSASTAADARELQVLLPPGGRESRGWCAQGRSQEII